MAVVKGLGGGKVTSVTRHQIPSIVLLVYLLAGGAGGTNEPLDLNAPAAGPRGPGSATVRFEPKVMTNLGITHLDANKGAIARYPSAKYAIPPKTIATSGDMRNDALMFASAADPCLVTQLVSGGCRGPRRRAGRARRAA